MNDQGPNYSNTLAKHAKQHARDGFDPLDFYTEYDANEATITAAFGIAFANIAQEVTDRQSADTTLQTNITSEASTRGAAIAAITPNVVAAAAVMSSTITSTSYADITGATVTITTTGRRCEIYVVGEPSAGEVDIRMDGGGTNSTGSVKCLLDGVDMATRPVGTTDANKTVWATWPIWHATPASGSHTFKLQGLVANAANTMTPRGRLVVREWA